MDKDDFELSESNFSMSLASNAQRKSGVSFVNNPPFTGSALKERAATVVQTKTQNKPAVVKEDDEDDKYSSDFD